jgi:1-acyl-sn-glycerol-3-phosphate acyltransferase
LDGLLIASHLRR